jgi:glycosyltransferase involved in cell wall biosynthesis
MKKGYGFKLISEKDQGLYDAMNKGIRIAQGEIIGILNSDDFYVNEFVIEKVVDIILAEDADCLYADLLYVDEINTENIVRKWKAKSGDFRFGWHPPHPTTFITKKTYEKHGLYKVKYNLSSDYDLLYRIIHKEKVKTAYLYVSGCAKRCADVFNQAPGSIHNKSREDFTKDQPGRAASDLEHSDRANELRRPPPGCFKRVRPDRRAG